MKSTFTLFSILLLFCGGRLSAQELTPPDYQGFSYTKPLKVHFPFTIVGIPFKTAPGSGWYPGKSKIVAVLEVDWKHTDDHGTFMYDFRKEAVVDANGGWHIDGLEVEVPEFDALFAGTFSTIVFGLAKGVKVEAVIDAVEARPAGDPLTVTYPSDCRHCVLAVAGVDATVVCDGAVLELRFPRSGSPRELMEAFVRVREAFRLAKAAALAGLL